MKKIVFAKPAAGPPAPEVTSGAGNIWAPRGRERGKIARYREQLESIRKAEGESAAMDAMADLCGQDMYYLAYEVLEYTDLYEPLHDDLVEFLHEARRRRNDSVVLIPRGHFKSTIATYTFIIWLIINNPDISIGLASGTLKAAKKFLKEVRNLLERRRRLHALFPHIFFSDPERLSPKWTTEELLVRRVSSVAKEPTVKAFGLEENMPTGDHFDVIIVDDVVDQDSVATEATLQKIVSQLEYLQPLLKNPGDPIHWVGTRYHIRDPYGKMLQDPGVMVYMRQVEQNGKFIFPTRYNPVVLQRLRSKMGAFKVNSQMYMDPQDALQMRLNVDWLKRHDYIGPGFPGYVFFCVVDPASEFRPDKPGADFTAITVWAVDWEEKFYLVDGVHDKLNPKQRLDAVLRLRRKWGFEICGYETVGFQRTDAWWLRREQTRPENYFRVHEIENYSLAKNARILGLQPALETGRFSLPKDPIPYTRLWEEPDDDLGRDVDVVEMLLAQYQHWPYLEHDDLLDTMQMLLRTAVAPDAPRAPRVEHTPGAYPKKVVSEEYKVEEN